LRLRQMIVCAFSVIGVSLGVTLAQASAATLVKYTVSDGDRINASLTGKPGDPVTGKKVAINRKQGNCLACHSLPAPKQQYHGAIGPDLRGVGSRYSEGELRLRIVNPKIVNSETFMPAFYRNDGLHRVQKKWVGKTILSAEQVEDLVAYLATLTEMSFKDAFSGAREAGQSVFKWNNTMYTTKLK
jgi:L-cysteine S-thiosulfotransferase